MKIDIIRQADDYSCAPCCLHAILHYFGIKVPLKKIRRACKTTKRDGTDIKNLAGAAKQFGLKAFAIEDRASAAVIEKHVSLGRPVIVMYCASLDRDGEAEAHVMVAYKTTKNFIYFVDPAASFFVEPITRMRKSELRRCWRKYPETKWILVVKGQK